MLSFIRKGIFSKKETNEIRPSASIQQEIVVYDEDLDFESVADAPEEEISPFERLQQVSAVIARPVSPITIGELMSSKKHRRKSHLIDMTASSSSNSLTCTPRTPTSAKRSGFGKYVVIDTLCVDRSSVFLAEYIDEDTHAVVKVILKKQELMSPRSYEYLARSRMENIIQRELSDEIYAASKGYQYIVKYLDDFKCAESNEHYIVMEYCDCGNLLDANSDLSRPYPIEVLRRFFMDILLGMEYIHKRGIGHRDIKPDNLFLHFNGQRIIVKIGDFGLSVIMQPKLIDFSEVGSKWYIAPEILESVFSVDFMSVKRNPYAVDVWAFGVVVYCLTELAFPFNPRPPSSLSEKRKREEYSRTGRMTDEETATLYHSIAVNDRRDRENFLSDYALGKFINAALEHSVDHRYTVNELLDHSFMRGEMRTMNKADLMALSKRGGYRL